MADVSRVPSLYAVWFPDERTFLTTLGEKKDVAAWPSPEAADAAAMIHAELEGLEPSWSVVRFIPVSRMGRVYEERRVSSID